MATIRKRGNKWQVQVRRHGFKPVSRSFSKKSDAQEWARMKECQADRQDIQFDIQALHLISWGELLEQYKTNVVAKKKSVLSESNHINAYLKRCPDIADLKVSQIKSFHFSEYRDQRLGSVKPATICRELGIFHHVFEIAKTEWGYPISENPVSLINKPKISNRRDRRLEIQEYRSILLASKGCKNPYIRPIIQIAVHTGMRRGEILNIKGRDICFVKRLLLIPDTKTGYARTIPISSKVLKILLIHNKENELFPITANAFSLSWKRLLIRASVTNLKFHDLRHEAISRFFERGLSIPEVALISGHRDYRMLVRYTHLRAEDLLRKI